MSARRPGSRLDCGGDQVTRPATPGGSRAGRSPASAAPLAHAARAASDCPSPHPRWRRRRRDAVIRVIDVAAPGRSAHHPDITPGGVICGTALQGQSSRRAGRGAPPVEAGQQRAPAAGCRPMDAVQRVKGRPQRPRKQPASHRADSAGRAARQPVSGLPGYRGLSRGPPPRGVASRAPGGPRQCVLGGSGALAPPAPGDGATAPSSPPLKWRSQPPQ
jgi:hypothetical protein